jgi:hypothetical protein
MNTQENNILLLSEILDQYENGEIVPASKARQCYLNELNKRQNIVSWIHDDELKNQSILRGMSKTSAKRDLLQNRTLT